MQKKTINTEQKQENGKIRKVQCKNNSTEYKYLLYGEQDVDF